MISLLIDESPRIILPSLACKIGLNEAIVLQQVHFLCSQPQSGIVDADGNKWIWNTLDEWRDIYFPFWSKRTVQNILLSLEKQGFLVTTTRLRDKWDATKYYRVRRDLFFAETLVNTPLNETLSTTQDKTASITQSTTSSRLSSIEPSLYGTETSSETSSKNTHITHAREKDAIGTAEERPQPNLVTKDWLDQWAWPERNLFAAFPEYFDQKIALGRINQTHIIAIRSAVRPGDEQAWQETIEDYQLAFDPVIGRYLPDKINNVLGVFRNKKQRIERELSQNGTNQQPYANSKQRRTDADVIRESAEFYAKWEARRNVEQPDPGNALSPL